MRENKKQTLDVFIAGHSETAQNLKTVFRAMDGKSKGMCFAIWVSNGVLMQVHSNHLCF